MTQNIKEFLNYEIKSDKFNFNKINILLIKRHKESKKENHRIEKI